MFRVLVLHSQASKNYQLLYRPDYSPKGKELAASNVEIVFLSNPSKESLRKAICFNEQYAEHTFNRDPSKIKFIVQIIIVIGDTIKDAEEQEARIRLLAEDEAARVMFSGWGGVGLGAYPDDKPLDDLDNASVVSLIQVWKEAYPYNKRWTTNDCCSLAL